MAVCIYIVPPLGAAIAGMIRSEENRSSSKAARGKSEQVRYRVYHDLINPMESILRSLFLHFSSRRGNHRPRRGTPTRLNRQLKRRNVTVLQNRFREGYCAFWMSRLWPGQPNWDITERNTRKNLLRIPTVATASSRNQQEIETMLVTINWRIEDNNLYHFIYKVREIMREDRNTCRRAAVRTLRDEPANCEEQSPEKILTSEDDEFLCKTSTQVDS
jgi:hypothetical protein